MGRASFVCVGVSIYKILNDVEAQIWTLQFPVQFFVFVVIFERRMVSGYIVLLSRLVKSLKARKGSERLFEKKISESAPVKTGFPTK